MSRIPPPLPVPSAGKAETTPPKDWVVSALQDGQRIILVFEVFILIGCFWPLVLDEEALPAVGKFLALMFNAFFMILLHLINRSIRAAMQALLVLYQDRK